MGARLLTRYAYAHDLEMDQPDDNGQKHLRDLSRETEPNPANGNPDSYKEGEDDFMEPTRVHARLLRRADKKNPHKDPDQDIGSEDTSLPQVPEIHKKINWSPGTVNIDYGGGKHDLATNFLREHHNVENLVYEPYGRSKEHNDAILKRLKKQKADTGTVANVLNVIREPEARKRVLEKVKSMVKPGGPIYISIYLGSGDGVGKPTSKGWQENRKPNDYIKEIEAVFGEVKKCPGGFLVHA